MVTDRAVVRKAVEVEMASRQARAERTLKLVRHLGERESQRQVAANVEMPKSTVHDRITCFHELEVDEETYAFFTSAAGSRVVQRLVDCLLLFVHCMAGGGLRVVESVLRGSGLDRFVASSPSTLGIRANTMEDLICEFGENESASLGPKMPRRQISALEDETWLGTMHLVAMDAVSGFILLEEPAKRRDGQTWYDAMAKAMTDLNAEIVQVTSDEGKGLVHHAEVLLGVPHSPDLFHVQREVSKGLGAALARNIRHAAKTLKGAEDELELLQAARLEELKDETVWRGRPIDWDKRLATAADRVKSAQQVHGAAMELQSQFRTALRGVSDAYHPVDIDAGTLRSAKELETGLLKLFAEFRSIAEGASLPAYSYKAIAKAERVVPKMVSTITFVLGEWERFVVGLKLNPKAAWQVRSRLLPALYLKRLAQRAHRKEKGTELEQRAEKLIQQAFASELSRSYEVDADRDSLLTRCWDAVLLFQRSSSPLEGRNGRLSQIHAVGRGLGKRTLRTLTVIANFLTTRSDGTTAAARFFGQKHTSLLEWVFDRMPLFALPRKTNLVPLRVAS